MTLEQSKAHLNKTTGIILKIATIIGAITVIAGGYSFYLNNMWKPKVEVMSIDFTKGLAQVKFGKNIIMLDGDASYLIGGDWGIRLGSNRINGATVYDRIELTKKGMVVEYLKK